MHVALAVLGQASVVMENGQGGGWSVSEAPKAITITRQQLYNVIRGKSAISPDMAL